jgi:hypothetical protein
MAVIIKRSPTSKSGHSKPLPPVDLNVPGRLYVGHIMTLYHIGHSTVYEHIRQKLLPPWDGKVGRRPYWRTQTIREHLAQ